MVIDDTVNKTKSKKTKTKNKKQAKPGLYKGSYGHATGTHVIEDRTRPWHSSAQTGLLSGLFGAQQCFSVPTEDRRSIAAV